MPARRILSIDILRGLGIMVIVVIHRIHYHWTGMRNSEVLKAQFSGPWGAVIVFTIVLFTMAGIFYFISGLVNAHSMYSRVLSGRNTARKAMIGGVLGGIWILLMNYVHRIFFMNGFLASEPGADLRFPVGLITGFIRDPVEVSFQWSQVTDPGTLALIGMVVIAVSIIVGLMLIKQTWFSRSKIYLVLMVLGAVFLLLSPLSKFYLRPVYENLMERQSYFTAACVGAVCQEFGLLPYLGYGFIGAVIGISIAAGESVEQIFRRGRIMAGLLFLIGLIPLLIYDREDLFGRGCIGSGICMIELALFLIIQLWLYKYLDLAPDEKYQVRQQRTTGMRRFGMLALTVYILEPFVAELFMKPANYIFGNGWNDQLPHVLLFGFFLLLFWYFALKVWEKYRFAGSLEWLTGIIMLKLAGKRSGKTDFKSL